MTALHEACSLMHGLFMFAIQVKIDKAAPAALKATVRKHFGFREIEGKQDLDNFQGVEWNLNILATQPTRGTNSYT